MIINYNNLDKNTLDIAETILFTGNGFLGVRGHLEEQEYNFYNSKRETLINGFYDSYNISYPEKFRGFVEQGDAIANIIDVVTTKFIINDEEFSILNSDFKNHNRYLDMTNGYTVRTFTWTTKQGKTTEFTIKRLASFEYQDLFIMDIEINKINHNEDVYAKTIFNYNVNNNIDKDDPRVNHTVFCPTVYDVNSNVIKFKADVSNLKGSLAYEFSNIIKQDVYENRIEFISLIEDRLIKKHSYNVENVLTHCNLNVSVDDIYSSQKKYLNNFWEISKIEIDSELGLEESVNFGSYALLSSIGQNGLSMISAKGLSGSGYSGHYFWDTEMYILPQFIHTHPEIAKQSLMCRINKLDDAIKNARLVGYEKGALYPWRTISGSESSAFFEAGMAQHHINLDIAYAIILYYNTTKDEEFLNIALEVIYQCSELFLNIGYLKDDVFHIDGVTGPDEYTVIVNDNYYTNKLFKYVVQFLIKYDKKHDLTAYKEIVDKIYLGFNKDLNIIEQDRDFLNKAVWDFENKPNLPLLLNYHPLEIYRYQVSKQADAVLALVLFYNDFDEDVIKDTIKYYDEITTHDSSLSFSIFAIIYAKLKNKEKSFEYFLKNARLDLDNLHHNTKDGIHTASMGGTWLTIVYGFAGLNIVDDKISIANNLPKEIKKVSFKIMHNNKVNKITVDENNCVIEEI